MLLNGYANGRTKIIPETRAPLLRISYLTLLKYARGASMDIINDL